MKNGFIFLSLLVTIIMGGATTIVGVASVSVRESLKEVAAAATENARQWDQIRTNMTEVQTLRAAVEVHGKELERLKVLCPPDRTRQNRKSGM